MPTYIPTNPNVITTTNINHDETILIRLNFTPIRSQFFKVDNFLPPTAHLAINELSVATAKHSFAGTPFAKSARYLISPLLQAGLALN